MRLPPGYKIKKFKNDPNFRQLIIDSNTCEDPLDLVTSASTLVSFGLYYDNTLVGVSLAKVIKNQAIEYFTCFTEDVIEEAIDSFKLKTCQKRFRSKVYLHSEF